MLFGALAFASLISAQETNLKGRTFISGSVGYSSEDNQNNEGYDYSVKLLTVMPSVGYFVTEDVAIGLGFGYQSAKSNSTNIVYYVGSEPIFAHYESRVNSFIINPMVRKYWNLGGKLYLFGQLDVNYSTGKSETTFTGNPTTKVSVNSLGFNLKPGLDYFISNNLSLEATIGNLGYSRDRRDGERANEKFNLGLNLGNINIGVKYIF